MAMAAAEEVTHIDGVLNFESGSKVKMGRKSRRQIDDCQTGKTSKNLDETCARDKAERGPEMGKKMGRQLMAK